MPIPKTYIDLFTEPWPMPTAVSYYKVPALIQHNIATSLVNDEQAWKKWKETSKTNEITEKDRAER